MKKLKIVIATGGFDPIHEGHIEYLKKARELGDMLIVGLNSDAWLERKKGKAFMSWQTRAAILKEFRFVTQVINFDDSDNSSKDAIRKVKDYLPQAEIIFANGGDRTKENIPEMTEENVEFVFGIGGNNKANSSSDILKNWTEEERVERSWGHYDVLKVVSPNIKAKRLIVQPGKSLSNQKHNHRNEFWLIEEGIATIHIPGNKNIIRHKGEHYIIGWGCWHQLENKSDKELIVFELQFGDKCEESDILRKE